MEVETAEEDLEGTIKKFTIKLIRIRLEVVGQDDIFQPEFFPRPINGPKCLAALAARTLDKLRQLFGILVYNTRHKRLNLRFS